MNRPALPLEILGKIAPVLAWVDGDFGRRLPPAWNSRIPFSQRQRGWLQRELPTYSIDNLDDVVKAGLLGHRGPAPVELPFSEELHRLRPPPRYDLLETLRSLNRYFLVWNGTEPCIREDRIEQLHELALRMPTGHIVRHGHARAVSEGVMTFAQAESLPELITLLPTNSFGMRSVIRRGLSESHLHLKAVTSAEETWAESLLRPHDWKSIRAADPAERRLLVLNLFAGRLLALSVWVSFGSLHLEELERVGGLVARFDDLYFASSEFEERDACRRLARSLRDVVGSLVGASDEGGGVETRARRRAPSLDPDRASSLLRWIAPDGRRLTGIAEGRCLPGGLPEQPDERMRFVHRLHLEAQVRLVQLSPREPGSRVDTRRVLLHEALFRYLVCRTHHWQLTVQQGTTTGLSYFRTYYGSGRRKLEAQSPNRYAELVLGRLAQWRGLRVLEGRVAPPRHARELAPWVLAYARSRDSRVQKFGLVVHFKKESEEVEDPAALRSFAGAVPRVRWAKRRRHLQREAMSLYRVLKRPLPVTPFIVGIDACNLELATPPEVFAPAFRFLRDLPITLEGGVGCFAPFSRLEAPIRRLTAARRLGMTYHVGEDFRHLLSGLRAIHEVVLFLNPQPGDRLGHGTALALRPHIWLEHNGYQSILPRIEWLDTLVWFHHFLGPGDDLVGELGVEDEIQRLSWLVYGSGETEGSSVLVAADRSEPGTHDRSPLTLWDAWQLRQLDPRVLDLTRLQAGYLRLRPYHGGCEERHRWFAVQENVARDLQRKIGSPWAYHLFARYLLDPGVRERGDQRMVVDMVERRAEWLELCARVEEKMKTLIHSREMVVEVNPSSNRIIGPMSRYGQHHVFDLTLDDEGRLSRRVRVSVNTDNPAVCNTTLAHEFFLLGEILMRRGVPEAEVVHWLEWLRLNGEEYNFARRLPSEETDPDMRTLVDWLRQAPRALRDRDSREERLRSFLRWSRASGLRDRGFSDEAIAADPDALERLLAAEWATGRGRNTTSEGVPTGR